MMGRCTIAFVLLLGIWGFPLHAQMQADEAPIMVYDDIEDDWLSNGLDEAVQETGTDVPELRRLDQDAWVEATDGLDYTEPSPPHRESNIQVDPEKNQQTPVWVTVLIYALLIGLALVLLYLAMRRWLQAPARPKTTEADVEPQTAEHLEELDLDALAEQARERGDWAEALRWHFLAVLQGLSERGWIEWTRDKTNRHYHRELRRNADAEWGSAFRAVAQAFERYRYGGLVLDQSAFEAVLPDIRRFRERAQGGKRKTGSKR